MKASMSIFLYSLALCITTGLGDEHFEDLDGNSEYSEAEPFPDLLNFDFFENAATMYQMMEAWSQVADHVNRLRELTPVQIKLFSGGLIAGVAGRVYDVDVISLGLEAAKIERECWEMVACELGSYLLHTDEHITKILAPVHRNLFKPTSMYWKHVRAGLLGAVCSEQYPSCKRNGYYMTR